MTEFTRLGVFKFDSMAGQTVGYSTADRRLPRDLALLGGLDTVTTDPKVGGGLSKGFVQPGSSAGLRGPSVYWASPPDTATNQLSIVRFMLNGNQSDYDLVPVTRMDNTNGDTFYAAELVYNASGGGGSGAYDVNVVRYVSGVRTQIGSTISDVFISETGTGSALGRRFVALGIRASGSGGSITLEVYAENLYYLDGVRTYNSQWNLETMTLSSLTSVGSVVDVSGAVTGSEYGFAWTTTTGTPGATDHRFCNQWALMKPVSSTWPNAPTFISADGYVDDNNGIRMKVTVGAFGDSDPLDTHDSTRWLLYEDDDEDFAAPIFDSGFLSASKLSYTFQDLGPGQAYHVRVQFKDNDGDIGPFLTAPDIVVDSPHTGQLSVIRPLKKWSRDGFPYNTVFNMGESASGVGVINFKTQKLVSTGETVITALTTPGAGLYGRAIFQNPRYPTGNNLPIYSAMMGVNILIKWDDASGVWIGTRSTWSDADGYFVRKIDAGTSWTYTITKRESANAGGPWTETTIASGNLQKDHTSMNGERVVLLSYDVSGTKALTLFINGILVCSVTGNDAASWYTDPGHQYHVVVVDENTSSGAFYIEQFGEVYWGYSSGVFPEFLVYADDEDTGKGTIHHVGPYMDPFDFDDDNYWYMDGGAFYLDSSAGTNGTAIVVYANPRFSHYNFSVRANIWGDNGVIIRFVDPYNFIAAVMVSSYSISLIRVDNGTPTVLYTSDPVTFVDGSAIILSAYNDPNSNDILGQVHYNGDLIIPASGDNLYRIVDGQNAFVEGRPGFGKFSGATSASEKVAENFGVSVSTSGSKPNKPSMVSKSSEVCSKVSLILQASVFDDEDVGDTHLGSQFRVLDNITEAVIWDSGIITAGDLTMVNVLPSSGTWTDPSDIGLDASTTYKAVVRYQDNIGLWSEWSDVWSFTTGTPSVTTTLLPLSYIFPQDPPPSQVFTESSNWRTLISQFSKGGEQRRGKWTSPRRIFKMRYEKIPEVKMDILWSFFNEVAFGRLNAFIYIHPETDEAIPCRFLSDTMSRDAFEATLKSAGLEIIELLGE